MSREVAPPQNIRSIRGRCYRPGARLPAMELTVSAGEQPGLRQSIPQRPSVEGPCLDSQRRFGSPLGRQFGRDSTTAPRPVCGLEWLGPLCSGRRRLRTAGVIWPRERLTAGTRWDHSALADSLPEASGATRRQAWSRRATAPPRCQKRISQRWNDAVYFDQPWTIRSTSAWS